MTDLERSHSKKSNFILTFLCVIEICLVFSFWAFLALSISGALGGYVYVFLAIVGVVLVLNTGVLIRFKR